MSKKSKFVKMSMLWEDYEITITSGSKSGYDVIFYASNTKAKWRHCAEHDAAIRVLETWTRQIEEGRVR